MGAVRTSRGCYVLRFTIFLLSIVILPAGHTQTNVADFTPSSFRVSESGAATYTIPIRVPPGIAGMEPKLALVYNSQAENGLLGKGWQLAGLSAVSRCPRGGVNYDWNDRYCLNGQRLVMILGNFYGIDGAQYRTERESYTKVISASEAGAGPGWFRVWTKSGEYAELGSTADSRIEAQGKSAVRIWAVNKISDTKGNYLTVTYNEDNINGDAYPSRIDYTGNTTSGSPPNASVRFVYEARTDVVPLYVSGSVIKTLNRLTRVQTYVGESLIREYRIAYDNLGTVGQSRLTSVQECAADGSCLPSINATWLTETSSTRNFNAAGSGNWTGHSNGVSNTLVGDFNGDGKLDILGFGTAGLPLFYTTSFNVCISNGGGYSCQAWAGGSLTVPIVGDFDADGKTDIAGYQVQIQYVNPEQNRYTYIVVVCRNAGTSFSCSVWAPSVLVDYADWPEFRSNRIVGDFNGDGRSDWALSTRDGFKVCTSTGSSMSCSVWNGPTGGTIDPLGTGDTHVASDFNAVGDFNGDGLTDLAGYAGGNNWNVCLSTGSGFSCSTWVGHSGGTTNNITGDFNGDGLKDLAQYVSGNTWLVCLSTGTGFSCNNWSGVSATSANTKLGDFNGDGKSDLATQTSAGVWNVCLSTGSGFSCSDWSGTTATVAKTVVGDFDGDGKADLSGFTSGSTWNTTLAGTPFPDRLQSITDSLGKVAVFTYLPITNSSVYAKESPTYPYLDLQSQLNGTLQGSPLYVTSSVSSSNGIGGSNVTNYFYTGAKAHLQGGGFMGFHKVEGTDAQTGIKSATTLRQDYPFQGLPTSVVKTQSSGAVLNQVTNTWTDNPAVNSLTYNFSTGKYHRSDLTQVVEVNNDLNGTVLPTVTTTTSYDAYGNASGITVSTGDGYSKSTTNTYTNDPVKWFLGRLTRSQVSSTTP